MKPIGHAAISLTVGSVLYNYSHSLPAFLSFLATGILIDADHYIDYVRERGISFNLKEIYKVCRYGHESFKKLTLFLHSYEIAIFLWLAVLIFNLNLIWKYAAMGLLLHVFIDQIVNPAGPLSYFLWFRIANNFETKKLFLNKEVLNAYWRR